MSRPARLAAASLVALVSIGLSLPVMPGRIALAANTVAFTPEFTANANGAMITIGNNLLTCPASAANCTSARSGAAFDNNSFNMVNLDADADGSTTNSSSSTLNLPAGASVLWAGLYWGARLDAGVGGQPGTGTRTQMMLRVPGAPGYQPISIGAYGGREFGPNTTSNNAYQEFANVTGLVQAAGNGAYWGANVVAGIGADRYAGWALTVVYTGPGLPLRNLTVFDGFNAVGAGAPQTINVSGFRAPQAGTVDAQLTMVAYEGDLAQTGDYTRLDNTQLATPVSPGSNFFDSINSLAGDSVTTRTPADRNMLGFDIKNLGASGVIGNGDTSATFTFSSNGDVYFPGVVGLAINLYAPDFTASSKTVVDLNGNSPARPGDTLQYTLNYANTGQDPAIGVVSQDPLPPNATYVPGSLKLVDPLTSATTQLSDGPSDDRGEYDAAGRTVRVRLGSGAGTAAQAGGRMACSGNGCADDGTSRASYTFQVTLDDTAGGTTVTNLASLAYRTGTTNIAATYTTNPASVDVATRANVSIAKVMTPNPAFVGSEITGTVTVTNNGPNTAQNVTMRDPIIDGWINESVDTPVGVTCAVDTAITCSLGNLSSGSSVVIPIHGHMASSATQPTLTNVAYASTDSYDPDLTDNVASASINLLRAADLAIVKSATPANAPAGSTISYTLTVTNNGPSDAQNVVITDTVADLTQLSLGTVTGTTGGAACSAPQGGSLRCTVATLANGATATVTLTGVLGSGLAAGVVVGNIATVTSGTADTNAVNNSAAGQVTTTTASADVRLTKTASPTAPIAGGPITYTITATNFGPSDAQNVVVTDTLPSGVTIASATSSRGSCVLDTPSVGKIQCPVGGLLAGSSGGPGASATITLTGTVNAGATGTITNSVGSTADASTPDPTPANNTDVTASATVTSRFDIAVSKSSTRTSLPGAARPIPYTITVTNNGPSVARDVTVRDQIPLILAASDPLVTGLPSGATCGTPQTGVSGVDAEHALLTCTLPGPIAVGGSQSFTVNMESTGSLAAGSPNDGADVTETVDVSAPNDDQTQLANNEAIWTLSGEPYSDLQLTKTGPATLTPGTLATYTFTVYNNADTEFPLYALAPTLKDTLPAGLTFVASGETGSSTSPGCDATGQNVSCVVQGSTGASPVDSDHDPCPSGSGVCLAIAPEETVTVQVTVRVDPGLTDGSTVVNTAEVDNQDANPDPAPANNTASATSTVAAEADVAVSGMTVTPRDPASTGPGSWVDIAFTLTNNGPSTARNVQFTTSIDVHAAVDPSTLPSNCTLANGELVCTIDGADLAPGQSVDIAFGAVLPGYVTPGSYGAQAHVSSSTPDSNPDNNDDSATFTVGPALTDLQIAKTAVDTIPNPNGDGHQAYVAGNPFAYKITVSVPNAPGDGVADAQNVMLADTMPTGFAATLVSTSQGTCTVAGGGTQFSCSLGTIAAWPGSTEPVTVTVYGFVDVATAGEQIPNAATATSDTADQDGNPTSVSASTSVDVVEQADLRLFKAADTTVVGDDGTPIFYAGGQVGYTLTAVNAGPSAVGDATIDDTLPTGLALDATASPGCTVTGTTPAGEQQVSCTVGAIGVGASVSIRVVATTSIVDGAPTPDDARGRPIANVATISSSATDPDPTNNSASAAALVARLADDAITGSPNTTTPAAGGQIVYTGYTINNGPSASWDNTGDTTFPPGFVPVSASVPDNTCTWSPQPPADPATAPWQNVSYTLHCEPADPTGPFPPGVSTTSVVVLQIPGDTPAGTYHTRSQVNTVTPESTYADNVAAGDVVVQHVSNTSLTKTLVEPNPMLAGQPATWRLTVTNAGPSIADDVVISDAVPQGMTFASASIEGGAACPAPEIHDQDTIVKCPIATLGVGQSASALVTFTVDPGTYGQQLCNSALVGSGSLDLDATDNEAQACQLAATPPSLDVGVAITPTVDQVAPGSSAGYRVVVGNDGETTADGVTLALEVPDGLNGLSITGDRAGTCSIPAAAVTAASATATCHLGSLAPGEELVLTISGTVGPDVPEGTVLEATATVSTEGDVNSSNDTASAEIDVVANAQPTPTPTPSPALTLPPTDTSVSSQGIAPANQGPGTLAILALAAGMLTVALWPFLARWRRQRD